MSSPVLGTHKLNEGDKGLSMDSKWSLSPGTWTVSENSGTRVTAVWTRSVEGKPRSISASQHLVWNALPKQLKDLTTGSVGWAWSPRASRLIRDNCAQVSKRTGTGWWLMKTVIIGKRVVVGNWKSTLNEQIPRETLWWGVASWSTKCYGHRPGQNGRMCEVSPHPPHLNLKGACLQSLWEWPATRQMEQSPRATALLLRSLTVE